MEVLHAGTGTIPVLNIFFWRMALVLHSQGSLEHSPLSPRYPFLMNQRLNCLTCNKFFGAAELKLGSSLLSPCLCLLLLGHLAPFSPIHPLNDCWQGLGGIGGSTAGGIAVNSSGVDLNV